MNRKFLFYSLLALFFVAFIIIFWINILLKPDQPDVGLDKKREQRSIRTAKRLKKKPLSKDSGSVR